LSHATFITIPLSHYCEKARWALDRVVLPYVEEPHVPLLHRLSTRRHGGGTVPILVDGSNRFVESRDILRHVDASCEGNPLYPQDIAQRREVEALEDKFDKGLGPHTRRWAYGYLLQDGRLLRQLWSSGVPKLETTLLPIIVPVARRLIRSGYRVTQEGAQRSLQRVDDVFNEVGERLSAGRRFLVGERFTAADLTFAALAAPVLLPVGCRAVMPDFDELPTPMQKEITRLRATDAGRFGLRLYSEERNKAAAEIADHQAAD
jgi:glutathione S-transferase